MKKLIVLALLISSFSFSPPNIQSGVSLSSIEPFNTAPFVCDSVWHGLTWVPTKETYVRKAELWMGMNGGAVADFGFAVWRSSDESNMFRGNWDHYADPTGINDQIVKEDFTPNYFLVHAGETLNISYRCESFNELENKGHVIVTLWSS